MKLQTHIPIQKEHYNPIDYNSKVLLLGSCFVENIGQKLEYYKFQNSHNPLGILFHPLAIENLLTNAINEKEYKEEDLFFHNEQWHCFEAHSKLSSTSKEDLLINLNEQIKLVNQKIHESTHVIITLGTAWVYRNLELDEVVANCHKVPQKQFVKELMSVGDISETLQAIIHLIKDVNPKVTILFTLSPVRHLKDGFVENTQSKAHLLTAIHQVVEPRKRVHYFPSFEIMMDELRDYRFYNEDLLHPNQTAVNYIWEKFQYGWISENALKTMEEIETIQKGLLHKPFNANSEAHKLFLQNLESKKKQVKDKYSHIVF